MSFRFQNLSPAQVDNASFIPQMSTGVYVPTPLCNPDLQVHHRTAALERAITSLQEKVEKQQRHIQHLEEKLEKNTIKDGADAVVDGVMNVFNSSITQMNSLRDAENFRLRQKLNRMARENRNLVSNLHVALRRRDFEVTPKSLTLPQSVDSLLFEDSDPKMKTSVALMDTKSDETRVFPSDLMNFDFPSTSANAEATPKSGLKESIGILVEDNVSVSDERSVSSVGLKLKVSDTQSNTSANVANKRDNSKTFVRRHGSSPIFARKVAPAPVPWDGRIKWKITKAFSNFSEEMTTLRMWYGPDKSMGADLGLFQHGLVFQPNDDEKDIYRAVMITGIPQINMANVLKPVCGGPLYSVHLLRTAHLTGSHSAIITFLYEDDAREFVKSTSIKNIVYLENRANASLIRTPTFPIPKNLKDLIFKQGHTRCLSISQLSEQYSSGDLFNALLAWNNRFANLLEGIQEIGSGAFHVRFHSIRAAGLAFFALKKHADFKYCVIKFVPDPCDRPAI